MLRCSCSPASKATSAPLYFPAGVMWVQTHTENIHPPMRSEMMAFSCAALLTRVFFFCCQQYLLTKTWENNQIQGFLIQIISFWSVFSFPTTNAVCVWTTGFHQWHAASLPASSDQNLHLMSAQQVRAWLSYTDPRSNSSHLHPICDLWNMHGLK